MTVKLKLPPDLEERLVAQATEQGISVGDYMIDLLRRAVPSGEATEDRTANSLLELVREAQEAIPESEWQRVPSDLAENHDHYLYGAPKDH